MDKKIKFNIFFLLFFILIGLGVNGQQSKQNNLEIAFQDFYEKDKVSLKICKCQLIKNKILTSREIGFAGIIIEFFEPNKILVSENGEIILKRKCKIDLSNIIELHLKLNNKNEVVKIDPRKGKYIGLNKDGKKFELRQLNVPFEYD